SSDEANRVSDTIIPATTNVDRLTAYYTYGWKEKGLKLFFSTYQSIDVISNFQQRTGLEFDLVICDEAHRTT
ncbi:DEAD/DEAH box helicase family protein, partial [Clostridium butyricum]|nr:DEAD/DEAH box helicase family protein [Clostridium butyricum]